MILTITKYSDTEIKITRQNETIVALKSLKMQIDDLQEYIAQNQREIAQLDEQIAELQAQVAEAEKLGVVENKA